MHTSSAHWTQLSLFFHNQFINVCISILINVWICSLLTADSPLILFNHLKELHARSLHWMKHLKGSMRSHIHHMNIWFIQTQRKVWTGSVPHLQFSIQISIRSNDMLIFLLSCDFNQCLLGFPVFLLELVDHRRFLTLEKVIKMRNTSAKTWQTN